MFLIPITGTYSALDLLRDKILMNSDQKEYSIYSQKIGI